MNKAVDERLGGLVFIKYGQWWSDFRKHEKYPDILKRVGI
jgi:hypothetical protein